MTAPPLRKPVATCRNKRRHPDEITARAAAMRSIEKHQNADHLFVYHCPVCRGWHLTRRNNGMAMTVTADNPVHSRMSINTPGGFENVP